jgi:hypothetical protein
MAGTDAHRKKKGLGKNARRDRRHTHPDGDCGNGACKRCSKSAANDPWLADPGSSLYGKRWSSPLHRRAA